jgi:hypothetical protein
MAALLNTATRPAAGPRAADERPQPDERARSVIPAAVAFDRSSIDLELEAVLATDWVALADQVRAASPCVLWTGYIDRHGYGRARVGGRLTMAHRAAWSSVHGPVPAGLTLDHLCRNRACVNVAHLEVVTLRVNILRGTGPSATKARQSHCVNGHDLADAYRRRSGRRACRSCKADEQRRRCHTEAGRAARAAAQGRRRNTEAYRAAAAERMRRYRAARLAAAQGVTA